MGLGLSGLELMSVEWGGRRGKGGGVNLWRLDQTHMLEWLVWSVECVCVFVKVE